MRAGTLRHAGTIEQDASTVSAVVGEVSPADSAVAGWRCSITPLRGTELVTARQQSATVTHQLRGRYIAGIKPQMWLTIGTRVFRFESVVNVNERNRELEILATEIVGGA